MRIPRLLSFALSGCTTVALLVGCSGDGQQNPALPSQTQAQPSSADQGVPLGASPKITITAARVGGLYAAQALSLSVNEYALPNTKNAPPRCTDSGKYVVAMAVGARGVLYVVSQQAKIGRYGYNEWPIDTFGPSCGVRGPTLHESFGLPSDVAVDSKSGRVYVAWYPTSGSAGGGIIVYDKGAIYPTRLLANSAVTVSGNGGVAVDSAGNVFLSVSGSNIVEFPGGQQNGSTVLSPPGLNFPSGLEFDLKDNLIVTNYSNSGSPIISVYAPPYNAAPTLTIAEKGASLFVKLDYTNTNLYASDYTNGSVDVYAYPSGSYEYSITNGLTQANFSTGIAVDPPSPN